MHAGKPASASIPREEYEEGGDGGGGTRADERVSRYLAEQLAGERRLIMADGKLTPREKLRLLEENRKTITIATGGRISHVDNMAYAVAIFSCVIVVILALLAAHAPELKDIALSFIGTVIGGLLAIVGHQVGNRKSAA